MKLKLLKKLLLLFIMKYIILNNLNHLFVISKSRLKYKNLFTTFLHAINIVGKQILF